VISSCPNHFVLLLFLGLSLSCAYHFFESTMGLGETTCCYAVFMPTSFRIQRVTIIGAAGSKTWEGSGFSAKVANFRTFPRWALAYNRNNAP